MDSNLNERVARFIAHYRTVVVESSLAKINECIECDETRKADAHIARELQLLQKVKQDSDIIRIADEETRYQELLTQNVLAQLLAIQGVESVDIRIEDGVESLRITLRAYYLYRDVFYDAGRWIWSVDMVSVDKNIFNVDSHWYSLYALADGTCFPTGSVLFSGTLCERFKHGKSYHPYYPHDEYGFCFGDSLDEIRGYLLTGEFVSAFQLISLCLYSGTTEYDDIPSDFIVAYDVNVRELAEYFGLNDTEVAKIEANHQRLEGRRNEVPHTERGENNV